MSRIEDYNTYKLIYPIFDEFKNVYVTLNNENFDMYESITKWQLFVRKFYYISSREKYYYFIREVLKDQNFINNFQKFVKKEKEEIKKEMKEIQIFYRNSYILFLLSLRT
jgi:hypothetical protein